MTGSHASSHNEQTEAVLDLVNALRAADWLLPLSTFLPSLMALGVSWRLVVRMVPLTVRMLVSAGAGQDLALRGRWLDQSLSLPYGDGGELTFHPVRQHHPDWRDFVADISHYQERWALELNRGDVHHELPIEPAPAAIVREVGWARAQLGVAGEAVVKPANLARAAVHLLVGEPGDVNDDLTWVLIEKFGLEDRVKPIYQELE